MWGKRLTEALDKREAETGGPGHVIEAPGLIRRGGWAPGSSASPPPAPGVAPGPYVGIEIPERWGIHAAFVPSAPVAAAALALALMLPETRPAGLQPPGRLSLRGLFSRGALYPSALLLTLYFGYGGILSFLPPVARRGG